MVYINENPKTSISDLGIYIKPAPSQKQKWELDTILVQLQPAIKIAGTATFLARDKTGVLISDLVFLVGWHDGYSYTIPDYKGCSNFKMDQVYDPDLSSGPYWGGFLDDGIAPRIYGFGVPKGYECDITFIYTQI